MAQSNSGNESHAGKQQGEEKMHGDVLDTSVSSAGEHGTGERGGTERQPAIPAPENGGHARSQAAHLGGQTHDHTKPVGDLRRYEAEREPPQEVSRVGKEHHRQ